MFFVRMGLALKNHSSVMGLAIVPLARTNRAHIAQIQE